MVAAAKYPNRLRALIKQAGFTAKDVAEESGIPLRTLFAYCKGDVPIPHKRLEDLATLLGYSPHAFVSPQQSYALLSAPEEHVEPAKATQKLSIHLEPEQQFLALATPMVEILPANAFVIQSEQTERAMTSLASSLLLKVSREYSSFECAAWFGVRVNDLKTFGSWQGPVITCQERQVLIDEEIKLWSDMTDQQQSQEYAISRRVALATLATLSTSLLAKVQSGPLNALLLQEFLAQCTTSITTCWHLLLGREFAIVQQTLARYLPLLCTLSQQPSSAQQAAAYLASQGCLLNGLLALHTLPAPQNIQQRLFFVRQATTFATLADDPDLHIVALTHLANAQYDLGQHDAMLQTYQQAAFLLQERSRQHMFPSLLRSKLQVELAHAYAQQGKAQEALWALQEARALFPDGYEAAPVFLSADYGHHSLLLFEGMTHLDLDRGEPENKHAQQAVEALAHIETLPATVSIPDRFRVEIINQQGMAAARTGDLDRFCHYLREGIQGAKALASEKRRQEALDNWNVARERWPHEQTLKDLADLFV